MKKVLLIFGVVGFALIACSGPSDQSMNAKIRDVGVVFINELLILNGEERTLFAEAIVTFTNDYIIQRGDITQIQILNRTSVFEGDGIRMRSDANQAYIQFYFSNSSHRMPLGEWRFAVEFSDGSSQEMSATTTGPNEGSGDNGATWLVTETHNNGNGVDAENIETIKRPAVTEAKHETDKITVKYTSTDNRAKLVWVALYQENENNRLAFLGTTSAETINTTTNATSNGTGNSKTITISSGNTSADITKVTDVIVCIADYVSPLPRGTAHHACSQAKKVNVSNGN